MTLYPTELTDLIPCLPLQAPLLASAVGLALVTGFWICRGQFTWVLVPCRPQYRTVPASVDTLQIALHVANTASRPRADTLHSSIEPRPSSPAPASDTGNKARVLVVDDVIANRMVLQMFLEQHGFKVDHARSGGEAITLSVDTPYDAILMDINMPEIDGFTAAREIRSFESSHRALIIAVTACTAPDTRQRCADAGMDAHFIKPINLRNFCRILSEMIASHDAAPAAENRLR